MTSQADPVDRQSDFVPATSSDLPVDREGIAPIESDAADGEQIVVEHEATYQFDVEGFELVDVTDQQSWLAFLSGC